MRQDDRALLPPLLCWSHEGSRDDRSWQPGFVSTLFGAGYLLLLVGGQACLVIHRLHGLSFLAASDMQCVVWEQAEGEHDQPGNQQGEGEQYQTEEDPLHTRTLLSMRLRFPAWHLEGAALVVEDFCAVAIAENQIRGAIMVEIGKADGDHHLVCTLP